jgi:hypothetical protein
MRSSLLARAALLSVTLLAACDVGNVGPSGNGPDGGAGPGADGAAQATPKVTVTVDKSTITTDLLVDNQVTVTVAGSGGFAGGVTLAAQVVDAGGAAITDWTVSLPTTSLTLPANGMQTATLKVKVPGDAAGLAGTVKITATTTLGAQTATTAVTANPQVTVTFTNTGGTCNYDVWTLNNPLKLKVGRALRVVDGGNLPMQIHFDGGITGIDHQGGTMAAGQAYAQTPQSANGQVQFYCHDAGTGAAVDGGNGALHQLLETVP